MKIQIPNPANFSEIVANYEATPISELAGIMNVARNAQESWAKTPALERGKLVSGFLNALEKRAEEIAISITKESGKIIAEARGEVGKSINEGRMTNARCGASFGDVMPSTNFGATFYTMRRPRGIIGGICPWNFPFGTPIRKVIPALTYGNAMVLKPSINTPGAAIIMQEVAEQTLPAGLLQIVIGEADLGAALAGSPDLDAMTFTGSVGVGKQVAVAAAMNLTEISLELGGKNPAILNDATNLEVALNQIYGAAMAIAGQRCTAVSRVLVHEDLAEATIAGLAQRANSAIVGDGMAEGTTIGPLITKNHLDNVDGFVKRALSDGAELTAGGSPRSKVDSGYFYKPTILSNVTSNMEVAREEVFGPVLSVLTYQTIEQALQIANDVAYGLTSCLFSEQSPIIERFISETQSGMIHINCGSFPDDNMPFVGMKASSLGVGGSNGPSTIQFYTSEHAVYLKGQV